MEQYEKTHLNKMRACASECIVLLKRNGDFPLREAGKLALYGSGARRTVKGGTGSGDVNSRFYVTAEKGFKKAGFTLTTESWLDAYDKKWLQAKQEFIKEIKRQARVQRVPAIALGMGAVMPEPEYSIPLDGEGDVAIYVLARISGEGNDRRPSPGDMKLTGTEIRDILECQRKYRHFLLVLNVGGVIDLTPVMQVENILLLSQLGAVTGDALADAVLGKTNPSGKLADTWSAWEDYARIGDFGNADDTRYREGIYVGYRYFDSAGKKPLFPFGYGVSYTTFEIKNTEVQAEETIVTVRARVTNTGERAGKEVLQLYVTAPWGELDQPYQRLAAFVKTEEIPAGECAEAVLSFDLTEMGSYDARAASYVMEPGEYILRLGSSSADTEVCGVLELGSRIVLRKLRNVGGKPDFEDWKPEYSWRKEDLSSVARIGIEPSAFDKVIWPEAARQSGRAETFVAKLSDEDVSRLCIGSHREGPALLSVIGTAAAGVAGAAGESCGGVEKVPGMVMADGPAGLRLSQRYTRDERGAHALGETMPAGMSDYMPAIVQKFRNFERRSSREEVLTQYCTAIPIGTAIAQSWNTEVGRICGDVVGAEMERFGVHLWLAPAFNIHRNPLCGRNFEYYSEDPLLSGVVGAALTEGVQEHAGRGVTVKHFCCNNQEANRCQSNSRLSERALREIYMKPFEICIRKANPAALMTSYNLVNGVHTSERSDLVKTVLREEWGWDGLIMTDWVTKGMENRHAKYPIARAAASIKAGNDLFMPGNSEDYRDVLSALTGENPDRKLTRGEIEACAARVAETAWRLCGK